jgi:hypothetical protein
MKPLLMRSLALLSIAAAAALHAATDVKLTRLADRVRVEVGGTLFTEYVFQGASRPYCCPILAADGTALTRDFPMKKTEGEETDHPWHRSLFFEHSVVNGVDFWNEGSGDKGKSPELKGNTVQDAIVEATSGSVGVLHTKDNWVAPGNRVICTDDRTLRFGQEGDDRFIDFEITIHALPDAPLVIGDNKDGTMATRIAQWMTMPHKKKDVEVGGSGHIVTATGARDADAWGKRADWCDYHAAHNGKIYGIAIFDHPANLRHPTWWMARDYGLFGANPFGQHDYEPKTTQPHAGDYTIPAGGSLTLKYRLYFHFGDEKEANLAAKYAEYADTR